MNIIEYTLCILHPIPVNFRSNNLLQIMHNDVCLTGASPALHSSHRDQASQFCLICIISLTFFTSLLHVSHANQLVRLLIENMLQHFQILSSIYLADWRKSSFIRIIFWFSRENLDTGLLSSSSSSFTSHIQAHHSDNTRVHHKYTKV